MTTGAQDSSYTGGHCGLSGRVAISNNYGPNDPNKNKNGSYY